MIKGLTSTGFEYEVDEEAIDYEFIDALGEASEKNPLAITKAVDLLFGVNKQKLMDHCRNEKGKVPIKAVLAELMDVLNSSSLKNL